MTCTKQRTILSTHSPLHISFPSKMNHLFLSFVLFLHHSDNGENGTTSSQLPPCVTNLFPLLVRYLIIEDEQEERTVLTTIYVHKEKEKMTPKTPKQNPAKKKGAKMKAKKTSTKKTILVVNQQAS